MAEQHQDGELSTLWREVASDTFRSVVILNLLSFATVLGLGLAAEANISLWIWASAFQCGLVHRILRANPKRKQRSAYWRQPLSWLCVGWCSMGFAAGWIMVAATISEVPLDF